MDMLAHSTGGVKERDRLPGHHSQRSRARIFDRNFGKRIGFVLILPGRVYNYFS